MSHRSPTWAEEGESLRRKQIERPEWLVSDEEIQAYMREFGPPRILVTGSRDWTDRRSISGALRRALKFTAKEPEGAILVHGDAPGADSLASYLAGQLGFRSEAHPADWTTHNSDCPREDPGDGSCWQGRTRDGKPHCKRAGFRRNRKMISAGADILLAFIRDDSRGASGTLKIWLEEDRPAIVCRQQGDGPIKGEFLNMERW